MHQLAIKHCSATRAMQRACTVPVARMQLSNDGR